MTAFKWALAHLGLKQREAAEFLGVSVPAIEAWARGTKKGDWTASPPPEAWDKLRELAMRQRTAAKTGSDADPWPTPGAEAMATILKWIASGKPPAPQARKRGGRKAKAISLPAAAS